MAPAAASNARRNPLSMPSKAARTSVGGTRNETGATPSKRLVSSSSALSPFLATAAKISRTASTGPSPPALGAGSRGPRSPGTPRKSRRVNKVTASMLARAGTRPPTWAPYPLALGTCQAGAP